MKKVSIINDILKEETFLKLQEFIKDKRNNKNTNFFANTTFWDKDLVENSSPVLVYNFTNSDLEMYKEITEELKSKVNLNIYSMIIHIWPPLSYITWHSDGGYEGGLTIYLNDKWNQNWGGYFMYKDYDGIRSIKPERNLGILQIGGVDHCVSTTNIGSELRYTLQIFFKKNKKML